jgi:hypothetical protein
MAPATRTIVIRQQPPATVTVVSTPDGTASSSLSPGAIAGIVIGSVLGFLLLLWIWRSCTNLGAPPQEREKWVCIPLRLPTGFTMVT